ncbi:two-component system sensor histidine kinase BaeS [Actinomadura luteofluorescens]|uniref:histidine kinase n=1 Tax=Actinomadura luteofluorescens TaxID=46163 RepID=A0A7Y9EN56_9ACTN|nr:ATP-binding protein [Actinomadura luteofluorescens]NYD50716.1 two-component system sensor histidine kinase BaeS [Actinomadura luteofluorescens]
MRHSLLARLVASSVLIAVCSITATAWLAARGTSGEIRQRQGRTLARDARINDALLGYAASHPRWDGVGETVRGLARQSGQRVALASEGGARIADSAAGRPPLPARPSAVVDPLAVDVSLGPGAATDRIDARAAGPFRLPEPERVRLRQEVDAQAACLRREGRRAAVLVGPGGRPYLRREGGPTDPPRATNPPGAPSGQEPSPRAAFARTSGGGAVRFAAVAETPSVSPTPKPSSTEPGEEPRRPGATPGAPPGVPNPVPTGGPGERPGNRPAPTPEPASCSPNAPGPTATEKRALGRLAALVRQCRGSRVEVWLDETGTPAGPASAAECLATARRTQLKPYVAPAAVLYIGSPEDRTPAIDPYGIAGVTAVILVLAVGVSVLVATRLARPVRAVTAAARRMRGGDGSARVTVRAKGEVGELGAAFNEMSEHLDRMERQRKAMVSDVSHELRTPLSNIRGWLEAAQDGVADLGPALTASLVEEATLLQHIVDDLQQLALADVGRLRLHPEPVDVADLVEQIATVYRAAAEAAELALTAEVTGRPHLDADPVRLRQAVGNLLANAVRYTPAGGRVSLRAYADGDDVLIEVADTGPGIAPEHLPHVFDRFWRAEKSRSRQTGGSGLGLAIVRQLAEAHGGSAAVRSEPGRGATFVLRLPGSPDDA